MLPLSHETNYWGKNSWRRWSHELLCAWEKTSNYIQWKEYSVSRAVRRRISIRVRIRNQSRVAATLPRTKGILRRWVKLGLFLSADRGISSLRRENIFL